MAATDPGELYNQILGDLKLTAGNELATIGEQEGFLRTNVGNAENLLTGQEPTTYTAEANRANKGGILNSGINTQRKGTIAQNFAGKRTANQAKLSQGLTTYNKQRETVGLKETEGEHKAAQTKAEQEDALQAQFPTVPVTGTTPTVPAARISPAAPPAPTRPGQITQRQQPTTLSNPPRRRR